jgi:hypothetical protein
MALGVITTFSFSGCAFGFAEEPTQAEVPNNPTKANVVARNLVTFTARVPRISVDRALFDVKTPFICRCILREGTCRKLLARGTRGRTGGTPVR